MDLDHKIIIQTDNDITIALGIVRRLLNKLSFSDVDSQKVLVSTSELTRNILDHAQESGIFYCKIINDGIQIIATDHGNGIANLQAALDGKKSDFSKGLGLGLSAVHRLMDDVKLFTSKGGTIIIASIWKPISDRKYFK